MNFSSQSLDVGVALGIPGTEQYYATKQPDTYFCYDF
jgi:hypothetical protein